MSDILLLYRDKARVAARMRVCEHHEHLLTPPIIYRTTENGDLVLTIDYKTDVPGSALLPEAECHRIVEEVQRYSARAALQMACHLASLLIDRYRAQKFPETTKKALISVFGEFPPDIGFKVIDWITDAFEQMPGGALLVRRQCLRLMRERRYKKRVASLHLKKHKSAAVE